MFTILLNKSLVASKFFKRLLYIYTNQQHWDFIQLSHIITQKLANLLSRKTYASVKVESLKYEVLKYEPSMNLIAST